MRAQSLLWVALTLSLSSPAIADGPAPGFSSETLPFAPPLFGVSATFENGDVLTFDGVVIERVTSDGLPVQTYETLSSFAFPSFAAISPDESFAVVGESSAGVIYRVDVVSGGVIPLTSLSFNYDATIDVSGSIYVSAAATMLGTANDLYRVDSTNGDADLVARVPGFSGPVGFDAAGNLLLGIAEAPNRIVRYTQAQLSGGTVLSESDGVLVSTGWNGLIYLVVDHETGSLFVVENDFVNFVEPSTVYRALADKSLSEPVLVAPDFHSFGKLELDTDSSHPAVFRAFQPELGGGMTVPVTDFAAVSERTAVRPLRPTSHVSGPGVGIGNSGIITYTVEGAYPGGAILLGFGPAAKFDPLEKVYILDPETPPIFWGLKKIGQKFVQFRLPVDQDGKATFTFFNPGFFGGFVAIQSGLTDSSLVILGSAPGVVL